MQFRVVVSSETRLLYYTQWAAGIQRPVSKDVSANSKGIDRPVEGVSYTEMHWRTLHTPLIKNRGWQTPARSSHKQTCTTQTQRNILICRHVHQLVSLGLNLTIITSGSDRTAGQFGNIIYFVSFHSNPKLSASLLYESAQRAFSSHHGFLSTDVYKHSSGYRTGHGC